MTLRTAAVRHKRRGSVLCALRNARVAAATESTSQRASEHHRVHFRLGCTCRTHSLRPICACIHRHTALRDCTRQSAKMGSQSQVYGRKRRQHYHPIASQLYPNGTHRHYPGGDPPTIHQAHRSSAARCSHNISRFTFESHSDWGAIVLKGKFSLHPSALLGFAPLQLTRGEMLDYIL